MLGSVQPDELLRDVIIIAYVFFFFLFFFFCFFFFFFLIILIILYMYLPFKILMDICLTQKGFGDSQNKKKKKKKKKRFAHNSGHVDTRPTWCQLE